MTACSEPVFLSVGLHLTVYSRIYRRILSFQTNQRKFLFCISTIQIHPAMFIRFDNAGRPLIANKESARVSHQRPSDQPQEKKKRQQQQQKIQQQI